MGTGGGCDGGPVVGTLAVTGTLLEPDRGGLVLGAAPLEVC